MTRSRARSSPVLRLFLQYVSFEYAIFEHPLALLHRHDDVIAAQDERRLLGRRGSRENNCERKGVRPRPRTYKGVADSSVLLFITRNRQSIRPFTGLEHVRSLGEIIEFFSPRPSRVAFSSRSSTLKIFSPIFRFLIISPIS